MPGSDLTARFPARPSLLSLSLSLSLSLICLLDGICLLEPLDKIWHWTGIELHNSDSEVYIRIFRFKGNKTISVIDYDNSWQSSFSHVGDEKMEGLYVAKLVRSFCRSSSDGISEDTFDHVALILVNISKMEAGRKILLEPKRGFLKQIIRQFDSASPLRKMGVVGTIRNCCFEADSQLPNLLLVSEFLWPALLLPVAGKKVYSQEDTSKMPSELGNILCHEREAVDDPKIRAQALEAIYLITLQEAGLRALWSVNGPRILQIGYEDEEDPKVMEAYELVGSLLVDNSVAEEPRAVTSQMS